MCGIFGFYTPHSPLDKKVAYDMGSIIKHRGPDDYGVFYEDGIALGNQRLSIIDIAGGHQPFISDDGNIVVVQNGEIYNHIELAQTLENTPYACQTNSDTEVILRLYESEGKSFIHQLNGMFAIAIWDKRTEEFMLFRDRVGIKPLYIAQKDNALIFASEVKSILKAGVKPELNKLAMRHFFTWNYVPSPLTMFDGIEHLAPGHQLIITKDGSTKSAWWSLNNIPLRDNIPNDDLLCEELTDLMDDATRIRLRADVEFGAFLSGGVDSSTIVGLMAKHMDTPVKTFAIGFSDKRFDESEYAQQAANLFNTDHTLETVEEDLIQLWPMMMWHCDQPHGDVSFMPTYRVSALAAKHTKMVLTGDGGDELFAGYDKYRELFNAPNDTSIWDDLLWQKLNLLDEDKQRELFADSTLMDYNPKAWAQEHLNQFQQTDNINRALYFDTTLLLSGNNLVKPDRMGMAVSLEARTPFLDYRVIEWAFSLPGEYKWKDNVSKHLLKKMAAPLIGDDLAYRKKQMFTVPIGEWFKERLQPLLREILLDERTLGRNLFKKETIERWLDDHTHDRANYTRELRALVAFELWARSFLDQQFDTAPSWQDLGIDFTQ